MAKYIKQLQVKLEQKLRSRTHTNKRFKTDSQRVAFLPCVDFSDLGGCGSIGIALLTT
ncbi:DUF3265 domain-containing protein [Vibrio vulnificus]